MSRPPNPNQTDKQRKQAEYMREWYAKRKAATPHFCTECGEPIEGRSDKRQCSPLCKGRARAKTPTRKAWKEQSQTRYNRYWRAMREFGLTEEALQGMYDRQQGCCAICGRPGRLLLNTRMKELGFAKASEVLCIDHDHATGKVWALLCGKCNRAIGLLDDDIRLLQSAIDYIRQHRSE